MALGNGACEASKNVLPVGLGWVGFGTTRKSKDMGTRLGPSVYHIALDRLGK